MEKRLRQAIKEDYIHTNASIDQNLRLLSDNKKRYDKYIIALLMSKNKNIQNVIFDKIKSNDIEDDLLRKLYDKIKELSLIYDISKIDILSKIEDEELVKELTEIMYIELADDKTKFLNEVLSKKRKEFLTARRLDIINSLSKPNISKDESEMLNIELNEIVLELSKK